LLIYTIVEKHLFREFEMRSITQATRLQNDRIRFFLESCLSKCRVQML